MTPCQFVHSHDAQDKMFTGTTEEEMPYIMSLSYIMLRNTLLNMSTQDLIHSTSIKRSAIDIIQFNSNSFICNNYYT